jgi:hypothetical protein
MWANGMPSGYGVTVDQHTNHYEGMVSYDKSAELIRADGKGTYYYSGGRSIAGTYGKGKLTNADDKSQQ